MLRHIISVSLAMTACATLIPTKANAISLTLTPIGGLQRNRGDKISFILRLDPQNEGGSSGVEVQEVYRPSVFDPTFGIYDTNELAFSEIIQFFDFSSQRVTYPRDIAALVFDVVNPIKDGNGDVSARIDYRTSSGSGRAYSTSDSSLDVQPVPEPLTIFGTATALGCGVLFKRKSSKKTVS
jgi:hypothetical protein